MPNGIFGGARERIAGLRARGQQNQPTFNVPQFQQLSEADRQRLFGGAFGRARQALGPFDEALQAAVQQRAQQAVDPLLEQFSARGQGRGSGVFQEALARNIGRQATEAQLQQTGRLASLTGGFFGGATGQEFGGRQAQFGGALQGAQAQFGEAQRQRDISFEQQQAASLRRQRRRGGIASGIGGILGGIGGALLTGGSPVGAQIGAGAGSRIGSAF